jgi:hypothetical protein
LILFALAGLLVVRHLPAWMIALVVAESTAEKFCITYGAAHFPGFFSAL